MKFSWAVVAFFGIVTFAHAQEEQGAFTDDDLKIYASVMWWAEQEKDRMGKEVGVWVGESETLSGSKYMELRAADKKGSLETVDATEDEIEEFKAILQRTEDAKTAFKDQYVKKIKDEIGAGLYNDLRGALKADVELKNRYEVIYASLAEGEDSQDSSQEDPGN